MSFKKAWVLYTVLRLLFFAVPFAGILLLLPPEQRIGLSWGVVFAAVTAGLIAMALSLLLLSGLRRQAAAAVAHWRTASHQDDATAEDELLDTAQPNTAQPNTAQPETAQPETVQPETVQPETVQPETVQPHSAAPANTPTADTPLPHNRA